MSERDRPHSLIAESLTLLGRFEEADLRWSLAKRFSPRPAGVDRTRANTEMAAGRFAVAEKLLRELLDRGLDEPDAFTLFVKTRRMRNDDLPLITRMCSKRHRAELSLFQQSQLCYALGKAFDDLRDYQQAIGYFDEANKVCLQMYPQRRNYDPETGHRFTDFLIDTFSADRINASSNRESNSELPLFVFGMMRSGTTLTASVLTSHSLVAGGSEQSFWSERGIELFHSDAAGFHYDSSLVRRFAREYLTVVQRQGQAHYVVDKNPSNFELAGVLAGAYPRAKMMQLKRHPVDNLLSLWMTPVSGNVSYMSQRGNLVAAYREYLRLWVHWEKVLPPEQFQTFNYEDLVIRPGETIQKMLGFLGLQPEPACFAPECNERIVLTPSVFQARQPINTGSVERWRSYEPWLAEFASLIE